MNAQVPMIDVSSNNHPKAEPINWGRVKVAGYDAVMIKATEGVSYVNPWLKIDAEAAKAAGLLVGYYHFARPGQSSPEAAANAALAATAGLPHDLGMAYDLEITEGVSWVDLAEGTQDFHARVLAAFTHSPVYLNDYFLEMLPGAPWGYELWNPRTARPRRHVWAWQLTTPAAVPGISVPTDIGFMHPAP